MTVNAEPLPLDARRTVRELALELPNATRVFERLRIDYCCGGTRPLEEACACAGVPVEEVARLLAEAGAAQNVSEVDFQQAPLAELIRHILDTHHAYTREEMPRLDALVAKVAGKHGANHPELLRVGALFQRLCQDLAPHMLKEERVLFPYLVSLEQAANGGDAPAPPPFGTVNNPVRVMMSEHDTAGDLLRALREEANDYRAPADACVSYQTLYHALEAFERDLHQHIHLENNVLFPRAAGLEAAAWVPC